MTVLPDTRLALMFLALPADQIERRELPPGSDRTLPPGTKVTITLAAATPTTNATAAYSFATGDVDNLLAPRRVILVGHGDRPTFVHTGVHVLNGIEIIGTMWTRASSVIARSRGSHGEVCSGYDLDCLKFEARPEYATKEN